MNHSDGTNYPLAQVLFNFQNQLAAVVVAFKGRQNVRQFINFFKLDVNNRPHYLRNMTKPAAADFSFFNLFNFLYGLFFIGADFFERLFIQFRHALSLLTFLAAAALAFAGAAVLAFFFSVIFIS